MSLVSFSLSSLVGMILFRDFIVSLMDVSLFLPSRRNSLTRFAETKASAIYLIHKDPNYSSPYTDKNEVQGFKVKTLFTNITKVTFLCVGYVNLQ